LSLDHLKAERDYDIRKIERLQKMAFQNSMIDMGWDLYGAYRQKILIYIYQIKIIFYNVFIYFFNFLLISITLNSIVSRCSSFLSKTNIR